MKAPTVETARLVLRAHRPEDLGAAYALWSQESVNRYISGKAHTEDDVWARLLRYAGNWSLMGLGYWVVEERATRRYVGEVGFSIGVTNAVPEVKGRTEMGWIVDPTCQGKGFGTEAVLAVLAWGKSHPKGQDPVCLIHESNDASIKLAHRCGFRESRRATFRGQPGILYELA